MSAMGFEVLRRVLQMFMLGFELGVLGAQRSVFVVQGSVVQDFSFLVN